MINSKKNQPYLTYLQKNKPYLTLFISKKLKVKYNAFSFKKCLVLYNTPSIFCKFVYIVYMFSDYFKFLYIKIPKYLKLFVFVITVLPIFTLRSKIFKNCFWIDVESCFWFY